MLLFFVIFLFDILELLFIVFEPEGFETAPVLPPPLGVPIPVPPAPAEPPPLLPPPALPPPALPPPAPWAKAALDNPNTNTEIKTFLAMRITVSLMVTVTAAKMVEYPTW
jgi:hypothetical protein